MILLVFLSFLIITILKYMRSADVETFNGTKSNQNLITIQPY